MSARAVPGRRGEDRARPLMLYIDLRAGRITAVGELDRTVAHRLGDALHALDVAGHRAWLVDVAGLTFCDTQGLRALAAAAAFADEHRCRLELLDASPFLAGLLRLAGLEHLLERPAPGVALGTS